MNKSIRAKFRCYVSRGEHLQMHAVYETEGPNKEWSEATPSGSLQMFIFNKAAQGVIEEGKDYFIDITPA